jgi:hypothetical protein
MNMSLPRVSGLPPQLSFPGRQLTPQQNLPLIPPQGQLAPGAQAPTQSLDGFSSIMPGFNQVPITPGLLQPPPPSFPAFDYGGLNYLNSGQQFIGMPYVTQVPVQGYRQLGNGQIAQVIQFTPYIPATVPGSITNIQQLNSLPGVSSTDLGALLQLAGIPPNVVASANTNTTGAFIPPIFGLNV